jgi:hypothetical protein
MPTKVLSTCTEHALQVHPQRLSSMVHVVAHPSLAAKQHAPFAGASIESTNCTRLAQHGLEMARILLAQQRVHLARRARARGAPRAVHVPAKE